jgi:hypothetical protein
MGCILGIEYDDSMTVDGSKHPLERATSTL